MSRPAQPQAPRTARCEGNLDNVGACLVGIVRTTSVSGDLAEEEVRAVYSLACIALAEWRLLDAADDAIGDAK